MKVIVLSIYDDGYEAECSILSIGKIIRMEKKKVSIEENGCVREAKKYELYLASIGLQDIEDGMVKPPFGVGIDEMIS